MFSPSDNYISADKPKVDFFRLILERDVRVAKHATCFPVPGLYSPLGLCFYYYRYFSLLKKLLPIQIFLSVNTVTFAPFN